MDGRFGRSVERVQILQPRRRAPGWDGCRERLDGNLDDRGPKYNLMWSQPAQRSMHRGVWSNKHRLFLIFGGTGYETWKRDPYRYVIDLKKKKFGLLKMLFVGVVDLKDNINLLYFYICMKS